MPDDERAERLRHAQLGQAPEQATLDCSAYGQYQLRADDLPDVRAKTLVTDFVDVPKTKPNL